MYIDKPPSLRSQTIPTQAPSAPMSYVGEQGFSFPTPTDERCAAHQRKRNSNIPMCYRSRYWTQSRVWAPPGRRSFVAADHPASARWSGSPNEYKGEIIMPDLIPAAYCLFSRMRHGLIAGITNATGTGNTSAPGHLVLTVRLRINNERHLSPKSIGADAVVRDVFIIGVRPQFPPNFRQFPHGSKPRVLAGPIPRKMTPNSVTVQAGERRDGLEHTR